MEGAIVLDCLVAARFVHFAAVFLLFGGTLYRLAIDPAAPDRGQGTTALVAGLSGFAWLAGTIAFATGGLASLGEPDMVRVFFLETPFGLPTMIRLGLFAILVAITVVPLAGQTRTPAILAVSAGLLVSQAWLGHAAEGGDTPLGWAMIAVYGVHVLAGASWIGGLPGLLRAIARRDPSLGAILSRYSLLGMIAVGLIVASGIANTLFHIDSDMSDVPQTSYAQVLGVKVALVVAMLVLAGVNRFAIMTRLPLASSLRGLRVSVCLEFALAMLVLAAAALLGLTPPPR